MKLRILMVGALLAALGGVSRLQAQSSADLIRRGIAAYRELEYATAARLFRQALLDPDQASLPDSVRATAAIYLGASELFQGRRDLAAVAFRQALSEDPRCQADELIFPPTVTAAFEGVRRETGFVQIRAPADTTIRVGAEHYVARLYASASHPVVVDIELANGSSARTLYTGRIEDSLDVSWDGLNAAGDTPLEGRLLLRANSELPDGSHRIVRLPLTASAQRKDTLPLPPPPPDSVMLPEHEAATRAVGGLLVGLATGAAAVVLPSAIGDVKSPSPARFAVGGALGLAGLIGLVTQTGREIPANVAANQKTRDEWRRQVAEARAENERVKNDVRLHITAGVMVSRKEKP